MDAPRSQKATLTTALRQRRVMFSMLAAIAVVALLAVAAIGFHSGADADNVAASPSLGFASVVTTLAASTTVAVPETSAPQTSAPETSAPETSAPQTTGTVGTVVETTTTAGTTTTAAPPAIAAAPPAAAAPRVAAGPTTSVGNCTNVGSISIASIKVVQPILAESHAFSDGLLCGNHTSDGVPEGVDILPGYASIDASTQGGAALVGQLPAVIFGHRNSHNRPFNKINALRAGDLVVVQRADGSELDLKVTTVELVTLAAAKALLFAPSVDGAPQVRLVACSHADGTPGGINYRWIATLVPA